SRSQCLARLAFLRPPKSVRRACLPKACRLSLRCSQRKKLACQSAPKAQTQPPVSLLPAWQSPSPSTAHKRPCPLRSFSSLPRFLPHLISSRLPPHTSTPTCSFG